MIKVAIVDRHTDLRKFIANFLNLYIDIECKSTFPSAEAFSKELSYQLPDMVLIDFDLPKQNGIDCLRENLKKFPTIQFVMFTNNSDEKTIFDALAAGASGYILKNDTLENLAHNIKSIKNGIGYMSHQVASEVVSFFQQNQTQTYEQNLSLSPIESIILEDLVKGFDVKKIAFNNFITIEAARTVIRNIYQKIGVSFSPQNQTQTYEQNLSLSLIESIILKDFVKEFDIKKIASNNFTIEAARTVIRNIYQKIGASFSPQHKSETYEQNLSLSLTRTENTILKDIVKGFDLQEIALNNLITRDTARTYIRSIFEKLDSNGKVKIELTLPYEEGMTNDHPVIKTFIEDLTNKTQLKGINVINIESGSIILTIECPAICIDHIKAVINSIALLSEHSIKIKEEKTIEVLKTPIKLTKNATIIFINLDNSEIKLEPRLFALYLFVLYNTEGVDLLSKEIESNLFEVYQKVIGRRKGLDDLKKTLKNTLEQLYPNCSKIRKEFEKVFKKHNVSEELLDYYCIKTNIISKIPIATSTHLIDLSDVVDFLPQH